MSDQEAEQNPHAKKDRNKHPGQPERTAGVRRATRDRGRRRHQPNQPRRQSSSNFRLDELRDLLALFTEHNLTKFEIEREGFRIHLVRDLAPQVAAKADTQAQTAGARKC